MKGGQYEYETLSTYLAEGWGRCVEGLYSKPLGRGYFHPVERGKKVEI